MKTKKSKLLNLPNTWEMIINIERDINKVTGNNGYLKSKVGRKSQAKNR
jgi:hypothetical protein